MSDFDVHRTVAEVALGPIGRVEATATLADCAQLLATQFDALIIFEPARMISARDIVDAAARRLPAATPVEALDLERAYCVPETTLLVDVVPLVTRRSSRRVIVQATDGRLLGRITSAAALHGLFARSPWIEAFQFALHIEQP